MTNKRYGALLIIGGVLGLALVAGAILLGSSEPDEATYDVPEQQDPSSGASSVVKLEEFGDYQCPPCAQLHPTLKQLKQEFGPRLNFVFRNLPLSELHKNALAAAQAAEAARMQNRFWEMHDMLYENQDLWKDDKTPNSTFVKFATDLGLDRARFERDFDSDQVRFRIEADRDAAVRLGIESTPAILINGRKLRPEATNPDGIRKGIDLMLAPQRENSAAPSPVQP
ncbi:MAG: thioredoxin domain-containing protein [Acidobacteriota bacterium]